MSDAQFTHRRDDGTFVVTARYSVSDPDVRELVRAYVETWTRAKLFPEARFERFESA